MSAPDWFGLIVRTVGLLIAIYGLYALLWGFVFSYWTHTQTDSSGKTDVVSAGQHFFVGIVFTLFGACLLTQAEVFVGFGYR